MNKILLSGVAALLSVAAPAAAQAAPPAAPRPRITVSVDPRVELVSIIFRLAGNREYNKGRVPGYVRDVDEHFGPHKDHAAVPMPGNCARSTASPTTRPWGWPST